MGRLRQKPLLLELETHVPRLGPVASLLLYSHVCSTRAHTHTHMYKRLRSSRSRSHSGGGAGPKISMSERRTNSCRARGLQNKVLWIPWRGISNDQPRAWESFAFLVQRMLREGGAEIGAEAPRASPPRQWEDRPDV